MSSIVSAFDKHLTAKQIGEKGHVENAWAVDYEQQVVQFFFQLVRSKDTSDLQHQLYYLLSHLRWSHDETRLLILYKLIHLYNLTFLDEFIILSTFFFLDKERKPFLACPMTPLEFPKHIAPRNFLVC